MDKHNAQHLIIAPRSVVLAAATSMAPIYGLAYTAWSKKYHDRKLAGDLDTDNKSRNKMTAKEGNEIHAFIEIEGNRELEHKLEENWMRENFKDAVGFKNEHDEFVSINDLSESVLKNLETTSGQYH